MRAKDNPWSEVPETLADESSFNSVQAGSDSLTDAEQIRHDLFEKAVQQALRNRTGSIRRNRGEDEQGSLAEVLTSSELKFLLKQE